MTHPLRGPELRALRAWKREQGDATPYVFTSLRGGPMTRHTVHHVFAEAAKAAGIEFRVHPHMLRHATGFYLAMLARIPARFRSISGIRTFSTPFAIPN
jgi:type 1 fimbriae regulatory protein FimB/type 1 fimbriae regulatory protein FimE